MESIIIKDENDVKLAKDRIIIATGLRVSLSKTYSLYFNQVLLGVRKDYKGIDVSKLSLLKGDTITIIDNSIVTIMREDKEKCDNVKEISPINTDTNVIYDTAIMVNNEYDKQNAYLYIEQVLGKYINYIDLGDKVILTKSPQEKYPFAPEINISINDKVFISSTNNIVTILR